MSASTLNRPSLDDIYRVSMAAGLPAQARDVLGTIVMILEKRNATALPFSASFVHTALVGFLKETRNKLPSIDSIRKTMASLKRSGLLRIVGTKRTSPDDAYGLQVMGVQIPDRWKLSPTETEAMADPSQTFTWIPKLRKTSSTEILAMDESAIGQILDELRRHPRSHELAETDAFHVLQRARTLGMNVADVIAVTCRMTSEQRAAVIELVKAYDHERATASEIIFSFDWDYLDKSFEEFMHMVRKVLGRGTWSTPHAMGTVTKWNNSVSNEEWKNVSAGNSETAHPLRTRPVPERATTDDCPTDSQITSHVPTDSLLQRPSVDRVASAEIRPVSLGCNGHESLSKPRVLRGSSCRQTAVATIRAIRASVGI